MAIENPGGHHGPVPDAQMPKFTREQIQHKLRQYDRTPFLDVLADWLQAAPTGEAIRKWAEEKPHLFANALSTLGRLSGFAETKNINLSGSIDLTTMSDSQIEDRLKELAALGTIPQKLIEGTVVTTPSTERVSGPSRKETEQG